MELVRPRNCRVVIRGGGEMGSGVAWRLRRCGFEVMITETARPLAVRRWVAFSEAVYDGAAKVEGTTATLVEMADMAAIGKLCQRGDIPIVVCPDPDEMQSLTPDVVVDAIIAKRNTGSRRGLAALVIGLGPGFTAGADVDCVVETNRGPNLGRCIWRGSAEANTGIPGVLAGESSRRVLRAPVRGKIESIRTIGDHVRADDVVGRIADQSVHSQLDGIIRGMLRQGTPVEPGMKIGDIDPRGDLELCRRISDKALAIAGGVLEAVLAQ